MVRFLMRLTSVFRFISCIHEIYSISKVQGHAILSHFSLFFVFCKAFRNTHSIHNGTHMYRVARAYHMNTFNRLLVCNGGFQVPQTMSSESVERDC